MHLQAMLPAVACHFGLPRQAVEFALAQLVGDEGAETAPRASAIRGQAAGVEESPPWGVLESH